MNHEHTYQPPRRDWRAAIGLGSMAVIIVCVVAFGLMLAQRLDPIDRAQREQAAYRDSLQSEQLQNVDLFVAALWRFVPLTLVLASAGVGLLVVYRRFASVEVVRAQQVIAALHAQQQPVPQTLTYSPHFSSRNDTRALEGTHAPLLEAPAAAAVPTFGELVSARLIGPAADGRLQPLILGYDTTSGEPVTGDYKSLYSCSCVGLQGSGKTWGAAFLLAQSALNGSKLIICDPHSGDAESLAQRVAPLRPAMLCDIADDDKAIAQALRLADDILQRRKRGDQDRTQIIVAIDEWASLRRGPLAEELPRLVEDFSTEGRKLGIHALLLTQRADKESFGDLRNTLSSNYVYRSRPEEARMLTGLRAASLPGDTLTLQPGEAYLLDTRGSLTRVRIPMMSSDDLASVGAWLSNGHETSFQPMGFRPAVKPAKKPDETQERNPEKLITQPNIAAPETMRILSLFQEGKSIGEIVRAVFGDVSGPRYNKLRDQVEAQIRQALRDGRAKL